MDKFCISCRNPIPKGRLSIMPLTITCVNCSEEKQWSAIHVIHHKTGNEIQIVKDPVAAAEFRKLSARVGFGTLRGLKPGVSGGTKRRHAKSIATCIVASKETFEQVGKKAMDYYEMIGIEKAIAYLESQEQERVLSVTQYIKIKTILLALNTSTLQNKK